jgi:hypothetical protein
MRSIHPAIKQGIVNTPEGFTDFLLNSKIYDKVCNGVGSPTGGWFKQLIYKLTPNTIWFLNVKFIADIHDYQYTYPAEFTAIDTALMYKWDADELFYDNLIAYIKSRNSWKWLERIRVNRAKVYWYILRECGEDAFLKDKTIS